MMQYRLRTLLIAVAVAGAVFARVACLKRWRDFHTGEVAKLVAAIGIADGGDNKIASSVNEFAKAGTVVENAWDFNRPKIGVFNDEWVRWVKDSTTQEMWKMAIHHQVIANRYDRAIYRPWAAVSEEPKPLQYPE